MALDLFKLLYKEFPNKENTVKGTENGLHNFTQDAKKTMTNFNTIKTVTSANNTNGGI